MYVLSLCLQLGKYTTDSLYCTLNKTVLPACPYLPHPLHFQLVLLPLASLPLMCTLESGLMCTLASGLMCTLINFPTSQVTKWWWCEQVGPHWKCRQWRRWPLKSAVNYCYVRHMKPAHWASSYFLVVMVTITRSPENCHGNKFLFWNVLELVLPWQQGFRIL